jgi:hypothetical protein
MCLRAVLMVEISTMDHVHHGLLSGHPLMIPGLWIPLVIVNRLWR